MILRCRKCRKPYPEKVQGICEAIIYSCPSGCDDEAYFYATCPACGEKTPIKSVWEPYINRRVDGNYRREGPAPWEDESADDFGSIMGVWNPDNGTAEVQFEHGIVLVVKGTW